MAKIGLLLTVLLGVAPAADALASAFPGRNGRIVYGRDLGLYSVRADGSGRRLLARGSFSSPQYSADGRRIAAQVGIDPMKLVVMRFDGTRKRRVPIDRDAAHPAWSPGGQWIAFDSCVETRLSEDLLEEYCVTYAVFKVRPSGRGLQRLADGAAPTWSPDGDRIAFIRRSGNCWRVLSMRPDGSDERVVLQDGDDQSCRSFYAPDFSPGGARLALSVSRQGYDLGIHTVRLDGSDLRQVTSPPDPASDGPPAWSPNGRYIAFQRNFGGSRQRIYLTRATGGTPRLVVKRGGGGAGIDWQPRPRR